MFRDQHQIKNDIHYRVPSHNFHIEYSPFDLLIANLHPWTYSLLIASEPIHVSSSYVCSQSLALLICRNHHVAKCLKLRSKCELMCDNQRRYVTKPSIGIVKQTKDVIIITMNKKYVIISFNIWENAASWAKKLEIRRTKSRTIICKL